MAKSPLNKLVPRFPVPITPMFILLLALPGMIEKAEIGRAAPIPAGQTHLNNLLI